MKIDVFLSFRGEDTRKNFVSHLHQALLNRRFRTFKCEEDLSVDQPASPQVLKAIEESKVAVVVISTNYSSSNSCLEELMKILEYKEKQSLVVVPIFYELEPSNFQIQKLADKLGKHAERDNLDKVKKRGEGMENVKRLNDTLIELTRTFQNHASGAEDDSDMIDKIMDYISPHLSEPPTPISELQMDIGVRPPLALMDFGIEEGYDGLWKPWVAAPLFFFNITKLRHRSFQSFQKYWTGKKSSPLVPSTDINNLVGMGRHMKSMNTLLRLGEVSDIVQVGICGMAGIGKTTLSKYLYERISPKFQDHYYHNSLNDTTNSSFQNSSTWLLEEITRAIMKPISSSLLTKYCDVVKAKFGHRKVLLIVDAVDHKDQLKNIREISRWFGPGSRLILITQDKSLLLNHGIKHLYEVEALKYDEALQLFSQFAFKKNDITRSFDRLCLRAVLVAGRIPLALKVLGSFLCGKSVKEWEFELLRLEASQANCTTVVSSYIGGDFYGRQPAKLDGYIVGKDDYDDELPSYWIA